MAGRSPARFLAPLALVAFALALFIVLDRTTGGNDETEAGGNRAAQPAETTPTPDKQGKKKKAKPKTYTVKVGDTPSGIAEKVGVDLETILELNPDLDPQTLTPGTKLKLSP
ncbi:MAG TPA: LysM domain-containing protein [Solirubrobacteraceae bacterium]|jgi:LysM repeat protein|nr:LysM domain-containing protein [Solirubrobacteraceae bacterium]